MLKYACWPIESDDENRGGVEEVVMTSSGGMLILLHTTQLWMHDVYNAHIVVEPHEPEEDVDLSTTHALCLEVKKEDVTNSSTHSTVPMAQFARSYLPGYRSEWQCGYYEFMQQKPESFTADQRVLLMTVEEKVSNMHVNVLYCIHNLHFN